MSTMIDIQNLGNCFGDQWVHKHLDLRVETGEILALVGGSGSGKTTVLRSLLMLLKPTEGRIKVFGVDVVNLENDEQGDRLRQRWGVLFQHSALFSSLTVLENIMFPLQQFTKLSLKDREQIARTKLDWVGLAQNSANKYPAELSGGMQKRAATARAIVMDPELLLLDEPTSGLDPHSSALFDQLILELRDMLGFTVVMISHDMQSLWRVPDQVAFLGEGRVLAKLPIDELAKHPHPLIQSYFAVNTR